MQPHDLSFICIFPLKKLSTLGDRMNYRAALRTAIDAAKEAGEILRKDFYRPGGPTGTTHHADADEVAERLIRERLLAAEPWGYLGEETGAAPSSSDHLWLVDPNDGTAAYMKGRRGSAVSIAVLRDGVPVLGVVYAFGYPDDNGDLIAWAEGCGPITRNGEPLSFRLDDGKFDSSSVVLVSQDAAHSPEVNARCALPGRFLSVPSIAYRLALAAAGEGVAAVSLNSPGSWDYGGGHALLRAAGGTLIDEKGSQVTYTREGRSHTVHCFGGVPAAVQELFKRPWDQVLKKSGKKDGAVFGLSTPVRGLAIRDARLLSRAQGCLLGQFTGDALGSLVEFNSAESIRSRYPQGVRELEDGGTFNTIAGQPTDDSEIAMMLARCIDRAKKFDPGAVLEAYIHWFNSYPFDIGGTLSQALGAARGGKSRKERLQLAARCASRESQANGSLMRISPLAIFGWSKPGNAVDWAREDSGLTHPNPVCRESCAAFVRAVTVALSGGDPLECYEAAVEEARKGGEAAVSDALKAAATHPPEEMDRENVGWVLLALQNAFYRLLHSGSFEEAVIETVACGGDTDTNAAICGALLGSVYGRESIPARWRQRVLTCRPLIDVGAVHPRPVDFWPVDVYELAESLLVKIR